MKVALIAMIAYRINVAYCGAIGDDQLAWEHAPDAVKKGIEAGVQVHLDHPDLTPEQSHESWLKDKEANGWVYGEVKDMTHKTHPNILPYAELPPEQHAKDHLFKAVVHLLKDLPDPDDYVELSSQLVTLQRQLLNVSKGTVPLTKKPVLGVAVRFSHHERDSFKDNLYGTGLVFANGETVVVPEEIAHKLLSHKEFERVDLTENVSTEIKDTLTEQIDLKKKKEREQEDLVFDQIEAIKVMGTKKAVAEYVESRYGEKVNQALKLDELKAIAIEKVHSFGVV